MPQTPRPQPAPQTPEPVPDTSAPSEIDWKITAGVKLGREKIDETDIFSHFDALADLKGTKPIMIYFYWPAEDAQNEDKNMANQVRRCKLMDDILSSEEVRKASLNFHCFKVNLKELSKEFREKYGVAYAPKVKFFDVKGATRRTWQITTVKIKPEKVAKRMDLIVAECKRMLEKMKK